MQAVEHSLRQYQHGIAALLYIADYNMPDARSMNKRRREICLWLLRQTGIETLTEQMAHTEKSLECTQTMNAYKKNPTTVTTQAYRAAAKWKAARKNLLERCTDILAQIPTPPDHAAFMAALAAAKTATPAALADMLATGGSVLVFGTPETINGTTYWVTEHERALLRTMQKQWDL